MYNCVVGFFKPPVIIKLNNCDHPLHDKKGFVRLVSEGEDLPLGKSYIDEIDGAIRNFQVIKHQYIGKDLVAVIVKEI